MGPYATSMSAKVWAMSDKRAAAVLPSGSPRSLCSAAARAAAANTRNGSSSNRRLGPCGRSSRLSARATAGGYAVRAMLKTARADFLSKYLDDDGRVRHHVLVPTNQTENTCRHGSRAPDEFCPICEQDADNDGHGESAVDGE